MPVKAAYSTSREEKEPWVCVLKPGPRIIVHKEFGASQIPIVNKEATNTTSSRAVLITARPLRSCELPAETGNMLLTIDHDSM